MPPKIRIHDAKLVERSPGLIPRDELLSVLPWPAGAKQCYLEFSLPSSDILILAPQSSASVSTRVVRSGSEYATIGPMELGDVPSLRFETSGTATISWIEVL